MSNKNNSYLFTKKILGAAFAIPLLIGGCGGGEVESQAAGARAVPVKLKTLETAILIDSTEYVGTLEAQGRVNLAPRINGRILRIFVKQGDRVSRGQPIIELEPTQQQEDVNAATQAVNLEKARLGQVQAELKAAEADRARAAAEVEAARANLQDAKAQVTLAEINMKRSKMLVEGGARAQQNLDDTTRELDGAIAQRDSRQETLNAALKSLEAAERRVDQSLANIDSQKAAVGQAEAQLGSVGQNLAFNTINAPIGGIVGSFNEKKVGDFVNIGEQITTLTNNQTFDLNIGIPTEYRSQLKLGLPVKIINEDGSDGVTGKITFISPVVNQSTQAIQTKVSFQNDGSLRDREYVRVKVIWQEQPGLLVPTRAVSILGGQKFVYVATPGDSEEAELVAKQQPVTLGTIQGQAYQVISGVEEGEQIVVTRILDLKDGTPITEESLTSEQLLEK
ncbi:MAG: efflux RND transporter periplasmic adaptor subunit [Xenococcaceae cyanobacterium MO_188.B32]|nr:efflux RND transporter periplasmic adaptor subunit [Xenococcaceae cyanobacterium MO_188.B32]